MNKTPINTDSENIWMRGAYILLFGFVYYIAQIVMIAVVVLQFMFVLFTKEKNEEVLLFGADLSEFLFQVFRFLTFNSDERPFPFAEWPKGKRHD